MKKISRRDFLRMGSGLIGSGITSRLLPRHSRLTADKNLPNIIVFVCDAMSARNLSLYGYPRKTTPNLERLAEKALVYHSHFANGNFTVPGTSSLLTGLQPWTHRAINFAGVIAKKEFINHNVFRFLDQDYFSLAFSQNYWATNILHQFSPYIDSLLRPSEFGLIGAGAIYNKFKNDSVMSGHAVEQMVYYRNSLLLSFLSNVYYGRKIKQVPSEDYPLGFPVSQFHDNVFTMRDLFDGITHEIFNLYNTQSPFFSYFHIFPPHDPYYPHKDFVGMFKDDGYASISKKDHVLSASTGQESLNQERSAYDAFIANVDMEIGRLIETLQDKGILDNTYFILTSDHGEMFERGVYGHTTSLMYDPVIHIPLVVLAPRSHMRQDFFTPTQNIDVLPTILNLAGKPIPDSCEGKILPGLGGVEDPNRIIFSMDAKENLAYQPFVTATYVAIKGRHKLIHYSGYHHKYTNFFELYDLKEDPEELSDKYPKPNFAPIVDELKRELLNAIEIANQKITG